MTKRGKVILAAAITFAFASCSVGSDKCGEGFIEKQGGCQKVELADNTGTTQTKDAASDGFTDQEQTATGIGDSCAKQEDCKDKIADYCMLDPMTGVGSCTIRDCTDDPDTCPTGYRCCEDTKDLQYPPICLSQSQYDLATSFGYCPK